MKYSRLLGNEIQNDYLMENAKRRAEYELQVRLWKENFKKNKAEGKPFPQRPNYRVLYIPGNSSAASIYSLLSQNEGKGIICETEADSLTGAISQDWGNFSHLLRSAFQHEALTLSRKNEDTYVELLMSLACQQF